jgi:hypothetical protein
MKKIRFMLSMAILPLLLVNCKVTKPSIKNCTLKAVSVESGNITNSNYVKNPTGGFHISDNAMGRITPIIGLSRINTDVTCPPNNAYQDPQGNVYIFEENKIPENITQTAEKVVCNLLNKANWTREKTYSLDLDAEICVDQMNFTIYMREKGEYPIYSAVINGHKIYKYYNRFVVEDYKNFLRFHEYLRPNMPTENLFDRIELDQTKFTMRYNNTLIPSGKLDYNTLAPTAADKTDKIYFESISPSNFSYRVRHIYVKHADSTLKKYFCENQSNCNLDRVTQVNCNFQRDENIFTNSTSNNEWFNYLNNKVFPGHLEPTIKGFECDCNNRKYNPYTGSKMNFKKLNFLLVEPLDSPPLPATSNGRDDQ